MDKSKLTHVLLSSGFSSLSLLPRPHGEFFLWEEWGYQTWATCDGGRQCVGLSSARLAVTLRKSLPSLVCFVICRMYTVPDAGGSFPSLPPSAHLADYLLPPQQRL